MQYIHKFVPGNNDGNSPDARPIPTLSGGDYLTHERQTSAQGGVANSLTSTKRVEGLISKFEEFHNQAELLLVSTALLDISPICYY